MLVEFTVENYKSFSEKQTLSLVAGNADELAGNCANCGNLKLLKAAGIYGPNASGKSNLLTALSIMKRIIENPAKPGKTLSIIPFKLDYKYEKKPSSFEVIFYHKQVRYKYGFSATAKRIYNEWLYANPIGRSKDTQQKWFVRNFDKNKTTWSWGPYLKGEREKLKSMTLENVLFLSIGAQLNNEQLKTVYEWFSKKLIIAQSPEDLFESSIDVIDESEPKDLQNSKQRERVIDLIQKADLGINDISITVENLKDLIKRPKDFPEEYREIVGKLTEAQESLLKAMPKDLKRIRIQFIHLKNNNEKIIFLPFEESSGTRRFFKLIRLLISAIDNGQTLLIDELETSLHPLLAFELIKFTQGTKSKNIAQLIFSTHDTTLLNPELFRRDQIWFTEKNEHGSTKLYSLLDYKPRKGEAIQKGYLSGKYGAIPMIEAFKLNG